MTPTERNIVKIHTPNPPPFSNICLRRQREKWAKTGAGTRGCRQATFTMYPWNWGRENFHCIKRKLHLRITSCLYTAFVLLFSGIYFSSKLQGWSLGGEYECNTDMKELLNVYFIIDFCFDVEFEKSETRSLLITGKYSVSGSVLWRWQK